MSNDNSSNFERKLKEKLKSLDERRKFLEVEADAILSELNASPGPGIEPMGIDTPLTDKEGYPRSDIDVYRARELRHRLAVIRTDHKELMREVEAGLLQVAAFKVSALCVFVCMLSI